MDLSKINPALVTEAANLISSIVKSGDKNAMINLRLYLRSGEIGMEAAFNELFGKTMTYSEFAASLYADLVA